MALIVKNFLFHRVTDSPDPWWPPMRPALFERIIRYLMRTHEVRPLELLYLDLPARAPAKPLATISFDDGFADNSSIAAEILSRHRCPATFFLVTESITHNIPTWTYLLDHRLEHTRELLIDVALPGVPDSMRVLRLDEPTRQQTALRFKRFLKACTAERRRALLTLVAEQTSDVAIPQVMMSWDDARALHAAGFTIGSHTSTHEMLGSTADGALIDAELINSAHTIEREVGRRPRSIAYPVGSYSPLALSRTEAAGYALGFAVHQRFSVPSTESRFAIPRVELYQEPWLRAWLRTTSFSDHARRWFNR
jgi:peptidoglycan/xylan/chitin deacetylase (PgdA/CDA1 family)